MFIRRRAFVEGILATSAAAIGCGGKRVSVPVTPPSPAPGFTNLPSPESSGIDHIVVVTMENRSFDHFLGWLPNANGWASQQPALTFTDTSGRAYPPQNLGSDYDGCGHPVPDNSYGTPNLTAYDNGKMDGFLRVKGSDVYSIGYYTSAEIPFLAGLAQTYTTCDQWFAPILAETFPNRMFLWAAQTDRLTNSIGLTNLPTIFDRLAAKNVSHRYYFGNIPFLALWGLKYLSSSSRFSEFLQHAAAGDLPAVSFVDPKFTEIDDGLGNDDHPHSDIRNGDAFLSQVFHALAEGPKWSSTVLIIIFDEWGGFFDHVAPPLAVPANTVDTHLVNGQVLLGFRVPTIIASPFTKGNNRVDSAVYDHTSILKLIEWRWSLSPLTPRDASAGIGNPAAKFNFNSPDASVPSLPQPGPVPGRPCFLRGATAPHVEATPATMKKSDFGALGDTPGVRDWLNRPSLRPQP